MTSTLALTQLAPAAGSKIVVVGGCGGIGRALVTAASTAGLAVIVLDLAASIERYPPPPGVHAIAIDASNETSVANGFAAIEARWGGCDSVVNLCGYRVDLKPVDQLPSKVWDDGISGNLRSAFLVSHYAIPLLKAAGGGTLVHVSSGIGTYGMIGYGPYAAAKGAINALAKTLAKENAPAIRVNVVSPSLVDTPFTRGGTGRSDETEDVPIDIPSYTRNIPMNRIAEAEDIIGPILFLAGPASRYMTGQVLHVNGGAFMP